ncbi:MAG: bifunctional riboflavin kinase/FAD synthetase [Oscillospiraceae bacterium]|nr:bifunctional riboflavin kinase/FAD synthetase [Oscillospiraceae bacterium]
MKEKTIYALGFFDGVHLGHQALMLACRHLAQRKGCNTGVVTFTTHPDGLVSGSVPGLINTRQDRGRLLCGYGMEKLIELPFDEKLMTTHWSAFLEQLVEKGAAGFVCGSDFRFGAGGSGTAKKLEGFCAARNLPYAIVPQQLLDGVRVSSTYIRQLLVEGKLKDANRFLGHPYTLSGQVVAGKRLGRTIGVPTANLVFPEELVVPKLGVYATAAVVDGKLYRAVTNIGTRPTVNGEGVTVEAHLLDFEGDLYGKYLELNFLEFLRPEQKFDSLEDLQAEIEKNALQSRKILEKL